MRYYDYCVWYDTKLNSSRALEFDLTKLSDNQYIRERLSIIKNKIIYKEYLLIDEIQNLWRNSTLMNDINICGDTYVKKGHIDLLCSVIDDIEASLDKYEKAVLTKSANKT